MARRRRVYSPPHFLGRAGTAVTKLAGLVGWVCVTVLCEPMRAGFHLSAECLAGADAEAERVPRALTRSTSMAAAKDASKRPTQAYRTPRSPQRTAVCLTGLWRAGSDLDRCRSHYLSSCVSNPTVLRIHSIQRAPTEQGFTVYRIYGSKAVEVVYAANLFFSSEAAPPCSLFSATTKIYTVSSYHQGRRRYNTHHKELLYSRRRQRRRAHFTLL